MTEAPLPVPALRVGVSGHRPNRLDRSDPEQLQGQIEAVLTCIRNAAAGALLRVLSSLAEGADRLVAAPALVLGYRLEVPLPFPRTDYEADFESEASKQDFREMLGRAETVFELAPPAGDRAYGYRAAGQVVVDHADVLLVISDGEPARGIGGTPEMIERAESLGVPVVRIDAVAPHEITFDKAADPLGALKDFVRSLLSPSLAVEREIARYRQEKWPRRIAASSYLFVHLFGGGRWRLPKAPHRDDPLLLEHPALVPYFRLTDALAIKYGERSRSAALRIQLLATSSVVFGLLAIPFAGHTTLLRVLSSLELGTTLLVVIDGFMLARRPWHGRWLLFRSLAEQLRSLDLLVPLGRSLAISAPESAEGEQDANAFARFYLRSIVRSLPLPSTVVNREFLNERQLHLADVLDDQAKFQAASANRYRTLERTLHSWGMVFFVAAVGFAFYDVVHAFCLLKFSSDWILTTSVLLPALGAAASSMSTQGEYKRLGDRARVLGKMLQQRVAELQGCGPLTLDALAREATGAADAMNAEVRDWQTLVATRKPSLPV